MDADVWKRILLSNNIREAPTDLCGALASVIKNLRSEKVLISSFQPFLAWRSIPF